MNTIKNMILAYVINVVKSIKIIHTGKVFIGLKATVNLGLLISPFALLIDKLSEWGIDNQDYITIVLGAIAIDHILGSFKHWLIDNDFSLKENIVGVIRKIGLVVAMGFLFEGLNVILKEQSLVKDYLNVVTRLIVFLYPSVSAFGNSSALSGGKFPPQSWLDRLEKFQKNLKPTDLTNQNKDEDN